MEGAARRRSQAPRCQEKVSWRELADRAEALGVTSMAQGAMSELLDQLEAAESEYEAFHWGEHPAEIDVAEFDVPSVVWVLGEVVEITYRASKAHKRHHWRHKFGRPRPRLAHGCGRLWLMGGSYTVNERGIVG